MDDGTPSLALRVLLGAAALAAAVILTGLFSEPVRYACVGITALAALLTATERRGPGAGWWKILAAGAALSIAGAALAELSDSLGGLVAVTGGALVVIGATVGFPTRE